MLTEVSVFMLTFLNDHSNISHFHKQSLSSQSHCGQDSLPNYFSLVGFWPQSFTTYCLVTILTEVTVSKKKLFFLSFVCFPFYFSINVAVNFLWLEPDGEDLADDHACQKCGKSDHPEWILLCDKCDSGWHGSCLRPALLVIPEGDWFCPPCEHVSINGMCIRCHVHAMYTSTM